MSVDSKRYYRIYPVASCECHDILRITGEAVQLLYDAGFEDNDIADIMEQDPGPWEDEPMPRSEGIAVYLTRDYNGHKRLRDSLDKAFIYAEQYAVSSNIF